MLQLKKFDATEVEYKGVAYLCEVEFPYMVTKVVPSDSSLP